MQSWLVSGTQQILQRAAGFGGSFFLGALDSLLGFAIMLFLLFFFLRDGDEMMARARGLIPLDEERKDRLFDQLSNVTRAIMFGTSVTALAQGFLVGVGFAIAGLPSPVVFGVLGGALVAAAHRRARLSSGCRRPSGCSSTVTGGTASSWSSGD